MMIKTIKLQILVANEGEQKKEAYELLKLYHNSIYKINNAIVNNMYLNSLIVDRFATHDEKSKEKLDKIEEKILELYSKKGKLNHEMKSIEDSEKLEKAKERLAKIEVDLEKKKKQKDKYIKDKSTEFRDMFKEVYGIGFDSSIHEAVKKEFPDIPDTIISPAVSELSFYKKEIYKAKYGIESLKNYKKGMPFNTRGRDLKFLKEDAEVYIKWVKGVVFKIFFGRDRSNNRVIVDRILDGYYKVCDSSISYGKKTFLNLCIEIPQKEEILDENKVLGVDLGLAVPAYVAINDGYFRRAIGSYNEFTKTRLQLQNRYKSLKKSLVMCRGGHGRKRKLQAMKTFRKKEKNWVKTYNHKLSKAIVDMAVKNRCKTINLEFLKGFGGDETKKFVLRNWSYFQLQQFIEYKAELKGIDVAYIDPYRTSKTCSECGHYEEGQRTDQATFECKSCKFKSNADYNAAKNIAKSKMYVNSKEECQFYKKQRELDKSVELK